MLDAKVSRRDFLKMLGLSAIAASVGRLLDPLLLANGQPKGARSIASRVDPATDVLTQRNNNFRTGSYIQQGLNQSTFTSPNIWGKVGELNVEGAVYAQPLYTSNIFFAKDNRFHNAVFIATALNNVYAFDADTFVPTSILLWNLNLGNPDFSDMSPVFNDDGSGRTLICATLSPAGFDTVGNLIHGIGIQSTPVIDRNIHLIYVSYRIQDAVKKVHQRLAAIDIQTGTRVRDTEIIFPPSVDAFNHRQRASLLLVDGVIYFAFGSHCEDIVWKNIP